MWNPKDLLNSVDPIQGFVEQGIHGAHFNTVPATMPTFRRMIVLDVISDPRAILGNDRKKIDYYKSVLGISNIKYVNVLPRNTIVGQMIRSDQPPMFVFPFFPSHLSLPCKPGECVWAIIEDPELNPIDIAYWMCRITEPHIADDVNHTHPSRASDPSFAGIDRSSKVERSKNDGKTSPRYELRNGVAQVNYGQRSTDLNNLIVANTAQEDYFELLVTQTDSAQLVEFEAIPRFKKRPSDIVLEGSNNALIVLGTDRISSIGTFVDDAEQQNGPRPSIANSAYFTRSAGSIDLVVGRGQTAPTFGKQTFTTTILGSTKDKPGLEFKHELAKAEDEITPREGDFDVVNDRSRIQISQRTNVDDNYTLADFNSQKFGIEDSIEGDAAIVIKTDKIRLIARSDMQFIVKGFKSANNVIDEIIMNELDDEVNWSTITIKSNGDVIIKPSEKGMIKLGDDNADRALLCTDFPATLIETPNQTSVSAATAPLLNTMGGKFGGTGISLQGTWASKILVTGAR